ncbi:hypothetical protein THSYN_09945 [Candidatus Thiodictyon syntrophicum]|uniref:Uncharacterized protein n=1 Tax=Candidatus Thiodictyon syntrophicum TaxID=1166950 RepID=A0A2K8U6P5_9GAMM|nr:hypothetical protein THSYN_09945 [Candidatus Thiodictyon syntrophicum]
MPTALLRSLGPVTPLAFRVKLPGGLTSRIPQGTVAPALKLVPLDAQGTAIGACTASWEAPTSSIAAACDRAPRYGFQWGVVESEAFGQPEAGATVELTEQQLTVNADVTIPDAWFALRGQPSPVQRDVKLPLPLADLLRVHTAPYSVEQAVQNVTGATAGIDLPCQLQLRLTDPGLLTRLLFGSQPVAAAEPCVRVRLNYPPAWHGGAASAVVPEVKPANGKAIRCQQAQIGQFTCVFDRALEAPAVTVGWGPGFAKDLIRPTPPAAPTWESEQALKAPTLAFESQDQDSIRFTAVQMRLCRGADESACCPTAFKRLTPLPSVTDFGCERDKSLPDHLRATLSTKNLNAPRGGVYRETVEIVTPIADLSRLFDTARDQAFLGYPVAVAVTDHRVDGRSVRLYPNLAACERDDSEFQSASFAFDPGARDGLHLLAGYHLQQQGAIAFADRRGLVSGCTTGGTLVKPGNQEVLRFDQPPLLVDDGKRTLVVLTATADFGKDNMLRVGRALGELLNPRLDADTPTPSPLILLRLEPNGSVAPVADLSNLRRLDPGAVRERLERIADLGGIGQDPLQELQTIETWLLSQELPVGAILYVGPARAGNLDRRLLGPPLAWQREGVRLSIVVATDQPQRLGGADPCAPWREQVGVADADCLTLGTENGSNLEQYLEQRLPHAPRN